MRTQHIHKNKKKNLKHLKILVFLG